MTCLLEAKNILAGCDEVETGAAEIRIVLVLNRLSVYDCDGTLLAQNLHAPRGSWAHLWRALRECGVTRGGKEEK